MSPPTTIPIIDIRPSNPSAASQLLAAARDYGFVFIANNEAGIDSALITDMFALSKQFFALPHDVKNVVSIGSNHAGKNHGWLAQGVEKLDPATQKQPDVKEAFNLSPPLPDGTYAQPLPSLFHANLPLLDTFQHACSTLCQTLLTLFADALAIPDSAWFTSRHDASRGPTGTIFRMLYYPAPAPSSSSSSSTTTTDLRAGAHSDYGSLTCLFQQRGQPGLEIRSPEGEWVSVPVAPEGQDGALPILVNIGDLLEDWTRGLLKSTVHRVVFPSASAAAPAGDRYSLAYFFHPLDDALLQPVPSRVVQEAWDLGAGVDERRRERDARLRLGMTAREHLMERLRATYTVAV